MKLSSGKQKTLRWDYKERCDGAIVKINNAQFASLHSASQHSRTISEKSGIQSQ